MMCTFFLALTSDSIQCRAMAFSSPRPKESRVLVVAPPDAGELTELKNLPEGMSVVRVGKSAEEFDGDQSFQAMC